MYSWAYREALKPLVHVIIVDSESLLQHENNKLIEVMSYKNIIV